MQNWLGIIQKPPVTLMTASSVAHMTLDALGMNRPPTSVVSIGMIHVLTFWKGTGHSM